MTPSFLEKRVDWFTENLKNIETSGKNSWLARNILIIEVEQKISLSEFLRRVTGLGYTKVWETRHRGEFSQRGGIIHLFPINADTPWAIEFEGNYISEITIVATQSVTSQSTTFHQPLSMPYNLQTGLRRRGAGGMVVCSSHKSFFQSGDYVVHIDHGIGIFRGETNEDYIIEYAPPAGRPNAPDLLYIPKHDIEQHQMLLKRIQPYLGFKKPIVHRLGTPLWSITKKKAKEDIIEFAKTLLATLAERRIVTRAPYSSYKEQEDELEASFLHEETSDQKKALKEIFEDMEKSYPMDRILTGDVGFGKTEVALRVAFRAILNGKQIVLLTPTTILADQHFNLFKTRLEPFGINVVRLTRLETSNEAKNIISRLAKNTIDIVIGTHKVLGKHIKFKQLGLLIIDEEQKFGVAHKEQLKKLYPEIDILMLSATPIPRTLHLGLTKIQSLSQITTPPRGRMEIKTFVLPKNKKIMKKAIEFELARKGGPVSPASQGGQVYFLANRIHKIPKLLEEIRELKITKPRFHDAVISVLHGRMKDEAIIQTMRDFRNKKIDILVSTTIIENGLDISEANTLIVEDATKLGLTQAHQLRGRIGRGDKEAFAYFLYPSHKLKERATERLEALERYSWLGAGIEIAKRDLELRGCGNILGRAQSGVAYKVGLNLYFQMLEETIQQLKTAIS